MVCGDISFTGFVGHAVKEIDEIWQVDRGSLAAYHDRPRLVNFDPGSPRGTPNTEGCKIFVTLFSYIAWTSAMKFSTMRGIYAQRSRSSPVLTVLVHFSGTPNFRQRISRTLAVAAQRNLARLAWLGVRPTETSFRISWTLWLGVPRYHAATCVSPSLMHLWFTFDHDTCFRLSLFHEVV